MEEVVGAEGRGIGQDEEVGSGTEVIGIGYIRGDIFTVLHRPSGITFPLDLLFSFYLHFSFRL